MDIILDTIINVNKLSNVGFGINKQYEIFISHSHRDIVDIDKLIMDKFEGRVCFIDSKTWECIYELEEIIISNFKKRLDAIEYSNPVLYEKIEKIFLFSQENILLNMINFVSLEDRLKRLLTSYWLLLWGML